jgi:hypothetical protein
LGSIFSIEWRFVKRPGPSEKTHAKSGKIPAIVIEHGGQMKDFLGTEKVVHLQAVLAHWDIPPVTSIAAIHEGSPVFKITTVGPTFVLKDISDAPNLTRLEFTRNVLTHVARAGLRVPIPLLSRSAQSTVPSQGRFRMY